MIAYPTLYRCQQLEEELLKHREEFKCTNEQLMTAVEQKFKLQQQIEAWQVCMVYKQVDKNLIVMQISRHPRSLYMYSYSGGVILVYNIPG